MGSTPIPSLGMMKDAVEFRLASSYDTQQERRDNHGFYGAVT